MLAANAKVLNPRAACELTLDAVAEHVGPRGWQVCVFKKDPRNWNNAPRVLAIGGVSEDLHDAYADLLLAMATSLWNSHSKYLPDHMEYEAPFVGEETEAYENVGPDLVRRLA